MEASAAAAKSPDSTGIHDYTCPMHPQVSKAAAGACPICGMALEPRVATVDQDHHELDDMTRRFVTALVLTVPVLLLGMGDALPPLDIRRWLPAATGGWVQGLLATPVVWGAGWPLLVRA